MSNTDVKTQVRTAFDRRVAVRVYNDQDIPRKDMEFILDTAWLSPSSVGLEGWRFLVLDRGQIKKFRDQLKPIAWGAGPQLDTASHFVLLLAEKNARYDSQAIRDSLLRRGIPEDDLDDRLSLYQDFQVRDLEVADDPRALFDWTAKQTYIAMGNMMTTAALLGIDSCPIEGFYYAKVNELLAEQGLIDSDREGIASMISFGYRRKDPKHPRTRKPREAVISWVK